MPTAVLSLPIWLLTVLIIAIFVGVAAVGLLAARRWLLPHLDIGQGDAEFGGAMVQAILVFYALAIALVAVSTWEQHSSISEQSSVEAATIATLYRQSVLYPEDVRDELQDDLLEYTTFIVEEAWPAQARGEVPEGGTALITGIQATLGSYDPTSTGMEAVARAGPGHVPRHGGAAQASPGRGRRAPLDRDVGVRPGGSGHLPGLVLPLRRG